jgi:hypothetical protein
MWDSPSSFVNEGGSMYTFLGAWTTPTAGPVPGADAPQSQNTIAKSKTGSNDDVKARMESMQKQRELEFAGVDRK